MSLLKCNTVQQMFDYVVQALIDQGKGSAVDTIDGVRCKYRSSDGSKCAIGHLLPDEIYDPDFEGRSAGTVFDNADQYEGDTGKQFAERAAQLNAEIRANSDEYMIPHSIHLFVTCLQVAHDYATRHAYNIKSDDGFVGDFLKRAKRIAEDFKLEWKFDN